MQRAPRLRPREPGARVPSHSHEAIQRILGRLIETLALELDIPIKSGSSTTFKREDLERGLEADECYWIASEASVRGKRAIVLAVDPPPDLAIEVEISRSIIDELAVYAALGVPEVSRHDGRALRVMRLSARGQYEPAERSVALPAMPLDAVAEAIERSDELDETSLVRAFQRRVRGDRVPG
jgi:Uma2 family endonuclease